MRRSGSDDGTRRNCLSKQSALRSRVTHWGLPRVVGVSELAGIDIVIPAYNAERFLAQAVRSVWATGYPSLKVYIVDDGSTDGTLALALALAAESANLCEVLQHPGGVNRGVSASRNLAIRAGSSPWIAFLDADDEYLPNRFAVFLESQKSNALDELDALHESVQIISEDGDNGGMPTPDGSLFRLGAVGSGGQLSVLSQLLNGRAWATSALIVRRRLMVVTGLFDERRQIAEDCHLWMRIACLGRIRGAEDGDTVAIYRRHATNTYRYGLVSRLDLLDAMVDAAKWSKTVGVTPDVRILMRRGSAHYALRACVVAREQGRPDYAWRVIGKMVKARRFDFLIESRVARQLLALLMNRAPPVRAG